MRIVFLTDGPSRRVKSGQQEIVLKGTTTGNMATAGRKSGTIIQALRHSYWPAQRQRRNTGYPEASTDHAGSGAVAQGSALCTRLGR